MKAFFTRRTSSSVPHEIHQNYEFEGDMSIDRHIKEEAKEFQNALSRDSLGDEIPSGKQQIKDMLQKAKTFYASSWNDVQAYVKSLAGTSLEDLDAQASTAAHIGEDQGSLQSLDSKTDAKKKWVIYDMVKLGFRDDQISDSVGYLNTLSEDLSREEMLKRVVEHLVEQRKTYDHIIDIENDTQKMLPKPEHMSVRWGPVAPPGYIRKESHKSNETQEIRLLSPEDSLKEASKPIEVDKNLFKYEDELENRPDAVGCSICFQHFLKKDMKSLLNCSHEFCESCYSDYLNQQIDNNKVLRIGCPWEGCQEEFQEEKVGEVVSNSQMEKYTRFKKVAVLNQNPNLRWCVRAGCDRYVIGKKGARKVVCECGMKMCFKCGSRYHFGRSCEAAIEKVYNKYAKDQNVQNCPQCQSRTEKSGGCHHITCSRCSHEWCWLCKARYTPDHYSETNPNHCKKIEINADDGRQQEDYIRSTYCSRMMHEPILIIAFPLFLLIMSAMIPQWLFSQYMRKKKSRDYDFALENGTGTMLFVALLGIILLPISMVFLLTTVIIDGLVDLYLWIYKKVKGREMGRKPRMLQPEVM